MRISEIKRTTKETDIALKLCLDGGEKKIEGDCGFFNHMMTLFASHSGYGLELSYKGDTEVDYHHSVEDVGIVLGNAFYEALGNKVGIARYGDIMLPMDESLVLCTVDISGRPFLSFDVPVPHAKVGDFDTELLEEFLVAFTANAKICLHVKLIDGKNCHHILEAVFKALGRTLAKATAVVGDTIPSTKGVLC